MTPAICRLAFALHAIAATLLLGASAVAASDTSTLPDNAQASRYGAGWECKRGFQKAGQACAEIVLPANAYLSSTGMRWDCDRGYRRVQQQCIAIAIPENAHPDDIGYRGWRCDRGFRETERACERIAVPAHAYLTGS